MHLGGYAGCHQRYDRSFYVGHYQFPVCARCTGVLIGQILGVTFLLLDFRASVLFSAGLMLITLIDWSVQKIGLYESTNIRRVVTGILGGFGYVNLLFIIVMYIGSYLV